MQLRPNEFSAAKSPCRNRQGQNRHFLLFDDFQDFHGTCLGADAAADALGNRAALLEDHHLHGTCFHALAAADAGLLVDHVHAGLGILGNGAVLTDLGALAALDAGHGLGTALGVGHDPDAGQVLMKFLIEGFGAGLHTFQTRHALGVFLNREFLHK